MKDRERVLRRALLAPSRFRGERLRLRPFSLWTLDAAEEMGLWAFLGGAAPGSAEGDRISPAVLRDQVSALAWAHSEEIPEEEIDGALVSGAWRPAVQAFKRRSEVTADLPSLLGYLDRIALEVLAATVKVVEKPSERKERQEEEDRAPENQVEPMGTTAIVWTLSGGRLSDEAQYRFLYRELSLPVALMYYHCALYAALKWTVPVDEKTGDAKREIRQAKAVGERVRKARAETRRGRDLF